MKMPPQTLDIRLDINIEGGKPVLVGVFIEAFGWILGGDITGEVSLSAPLPLEGENVLIPESVRPRTLTRVKKMLRIYDYYKNGRNNFKHRRPGE